MLVLKRIGKFVIRNKSIFITVVIVFVLYHADFAYITKDKNFSAVPQISCTFVSIVLGFLGVLLSIIFAIKEKTDIIQYFFKSVNWKIFKSKFWISFVSGLLNIALSMSLMVADLLEKSVMEIVFYAWTFSLIYFVLSQYEFYSLFFTMIEKSSEKENNPNLLGTDDQISRSDQESLNKLILQQNKTRHDNQTGD